VRTTELGWLRSLADDGGQLLFLTGAGISAESGIPTFRGKEGFWTQGSRVYQPQELATWSAFSRNPQLVWPWYLWRRQRCRIADPNSAHEDLVSLEAHLGDQFLLITQNVDGLHTRAGNSRSRTYEIHGNIDYMRCVKRCGPKRPVPDLPNIHEACRFDASWASALECGPCRAWMRPHVLWFDETYDEANYRFESSIQAGSEADVLVVIGTTGATTLPAHLLHLAVRRRIPIIDINPEPNPFAEAAERSAGAWLQCSASMGIRALRDALMVG